MPHLSAIVKGRVQGVGYRFFVSDVARNLELVGYVKNLPSGDVEVQADGSREKLDQLLDALWKGPGFARVLDIATQFSDAEQGYDSFQISFW
jgi:acylphosphatase